jgi:Spy/CpxP family protein refolding chaperone
MRFISILIALAMAAHPALGNEAHHKHDHASPYVGQQMRDIKTLSQEDIAELSRGGGWGLAKAAELNGMPGPTHVLDMASDLALSAEQTDKVSRVRDEMRHKAVVLGRRFVAGEAELEARFRDGEIGEEELDRRVKEIEMIRAELRVAHLAAHIAVFRILTKDQVAQYGRLRGYR